MLVVDKRLCNNSGVYLSGSLVSSSLKNFSQISDCPHQLLYKFLVEGPTDLHWYCQLLPIFSIASLAWKGALMIFRVYSPKHTFSSSTA